MAECLLCKCEALVQTGVHQNKKKKNAAKKIGREKKKTYVLALRTI
jgi:hypothetical protein